MLAKPRRSKSIPGEKRHFNSNGSSPASIFPRPLQPKLVIENAQIKDAGDYRVLIKNKGGEIYSETVQLVLQQVPIQTKVEDGQITLSAKPSPAQRYAIETSSDLAKLESVKTRYAKTKPIEFKLGIGRAAPAQFFRICLYE